MIPSVTESLWAAARWLLDDLPFVGFIREYPTAVGSLGSDTRLKRNQALHKDKIEDRDPATCHLLISAEVNYFPLAEHGVKGTQELVPELWAGLGSLPSREHWAGEDQNKSPKERSQNAASIWNAFTFMLLLQIGRLLGPIFTVMYSLEVIANVIYTALQGKWS